MVAWDLSLFSFPTSVKWVHYTDDIMLTCEDLASAAGHSADFVGTSVKNHMGREPTENLRPRHCHKVWGVILSGKTYVVPEAVFDKCKLIQLQKCNGNTSLCGDSGGFREFLSSTWYGASIHMLPGKKRAFVGLGMRTARHLWEGKITSERDSSCRHLKQGYHLNELCLWLWEAWVGHWGRDNRRGEWP